MNLATYEHALYLWEQANLPAIQSLLDEAISKIKDLESSSLDSRKSLSTDTKKFKKLAEEEKLAKIQFLIKQYQKEIDFLTTRSAFSENITVQLYERLIEQPDPSALIRSVIDGLKSEDENIHDIKAENARLNELISKHIDCESLKKRLNDLEQTSAKTLSNRLIAKEKEINSKWEEKERNWNNREQELLSQLENLKGTNSVLEKKIGEQVDLDGDDSSNTNQNSRIQLQLLSQELEAAQIRIMSLESRNEELNTEVSKLSSDEERDSQLHEANVKVDRLESENAKLIISLEQERKSQASKAKTSSDELQSTSLELKTYKTELETLRRKLNNYSDYEKIKQELNAMKKIEFGTSDDSGDETVGSENQTVNSSLKTANQKLQNNIVKMNMEKTKYIKESENLKKKIQTLESRIKSLETLNATLESEIGKVEDVTNQFTETQSMVSGATRQISNRHASNDRLSPTSSIIGIPEERELDTFSNSNSAILPIVTKQRDRFRTRNLELETQLKKGSQEQSRLKAELKRLKQDNSTLYERVKILSSYSHGSNRTTLSDLESPFSAEYEENMHPLADFKQRELDRYERKKMPPLERLFLSFAKIILANKNTRMLFMLYCVGLHGLVVIMTIYVTS